MPSNDGTERTHSATEAIWLEQGSMGSGGPLDLGDESSICIGRGPLNDIVLDCPWVSWRHVGVYWDQDSYWISDLGSRNGTFVNGQRLGKDPRRLENQDRIGLGDTRSPINWVFVDWRETIEMPRSAAAG